MALTAKRIIVDVATGEQVVRALTAEEHVAYDAQQVAGQQAAQAETTRLADLAAARALVVQTAAGAVGVRFDALTTTQLRSLLAIVLWQGGALDAAGVVRPLAQWVRST